jgi:hypothetical protein
VSSKRNCLYRRYSGTKPPPKNIVKKNTYVKSFLPGIFFFEREYAVIAARIVPSDAPPTVATAEVIKPVIIDLFLSTVLYASKVNPLGSKKNPPLIAKYGLLNEYIITYQKG